MTQQDDNDDGGADHSKCLYVVSNTNNIAAEESYD